MTTAKILEKRFCKECKWPVVFACCNDTFNNFKDAKHFDCWVYCSNKGCVNHDGTGIYMDYPSWITE